MSELNIDFIPRSDIELKDKDIIDTHRDLINQYKYVEATEKINNDASMCNKGIKASFFNYIEQKIQELQVYLLNRNAAPDEFYSLTEPTEEQMKGKLFWIKPII